MAQKQSTLTKPPELPPKTNSKHNCFLLLVDKSRSYPQGSLLRSLGGGKYHKYEPNNEHSEEIFCSPVEVAELSAEESKLLDAIYSPTKRCKLPCVTAIIRYSGNIASIYGDVHRFGVEIEVA